MFVVKSFKVSVVSDSSGPVLLLFAITRFVVKSVKIFVVVVCLPRPMEGMG